MGLGRLFDNGLIMVYESFWKDIVYLVSCVNEMICYDSVFNRYLYSEKKEYSFCLELL